MILVALSSLAIGVVAGFLYASLRGPDRTSVPAIELEDDPSDDDRPRDRPDREGRNAEHRSGRKAPPLGGSGTPSGVASTEGGATGGSGGSGGSGTSGGSGGSRGTGGQGSDDPVGAQPVPPPPPALAGTGDDDDDDDEDDGDDDDDAAEDDT
jgi:hypothetical protein